ncbi:MAG: LD-carboxypeptidase [candidate division KSB1 bacterium]|nr:LD-carboxypeptidase [candidate division KSB1 bacterium]
MKHRSPHWLDRRQFMTGLAVLASVPSVVPKFVQENRQSREIIKPARIALGDTVGLIAPASNAFEPTTIREGVETLQSLGFRVKLGAHIRDKLGYLAGSDADRVADLHQMFRDNEVKAIFALRGGYGSMRLLNLIDYDLIKNNPKILIGYSDITSLLIAIHQKTGLVTFHGPVAISSFTKYTRDIFWKMLGSPQPFGELPHPEPANPLRPTAHLNCIRPGKATGRLIGGNLTLFTALLGTPYEADTHGAILFLEETGEEPYDIDRMLTQLLLAGKLNQIAGLAFDKCPDCKPSDYKPAFYTTLSVEEVLVDRLGNLNCPISYGLHLGHESDKPTLPIGITVTLDAERNALIIEEPAVL